MWYDDFDCHWLEERYLKSLYPDKFLEYHEILDDYFEIEDEEKLIATLCEVRDEEIEKYKTQYDFDQHLYEIRRYA